MRLQLHCIEGRDRDGASFESLLPKVPIRIRSRSTDILGIWRVMTALLLAALQFMSLAPAQAQAGTPLIGAGSIHTCALTSDSGVKCWGVNWYGQLGDGTQVDRLTPVDVKGLASGVSAVSAANMHTCALTTGGGVKCWGNSGSGALGHDTFLDPLVPGDVTGLTSGVKAIAAGASHTCALTSAGGMKCWGYNGYGRLGDGSTTDRRTPVDVVGLTSGVSAIAAGSDHTCALTSTGGVKCWGYNDSGILGDGSSNNLSTPASVNGLASGVIAITAGGAHTCALTSTGGVKCWGWNYYGQLGNNSLTSSTVPVDVAGLSAGVIAIAAGSTHTCALTSIGGVKCWGRNTWGAVGDGTTIDRRTPVDVSGLTSGVSDVAAGRGERGTACARTLGGVLKCWGYNDHGQLGDGTLTQRLTPVDVIGLVKPVVTQNLGAGWNLLGNGSSTALDVASAFGDVSKVTSVWKWVAPTAKWAFYTPTETDRGATYAASKGYDTLSTVAGGEGFWVNAKTPFTATLPTGTAISSTSFKNMPSGWSLIATGDNKTPSAFNTSLNTTNPAPGQVPINFTSLWTWDTALSKWYFYAPSLEQSGDLSSYNTSKGYLDFGSKVLTPTGGYWVNVGAGAIVAPPATATVQPSTQSQTVDVGGVIVTIPGGLLTGVTTLSVGVNRTVEQLPKPTTAAALLGGYDISLGSASTFEQALTVEIPYDPALLDPTVPEGKNLWVSSWDPQSASWQEHVVTVDTVRKRLIVRTDHLSTWAYWKLNGYTYVEADSGYGPFEVYYRPTDAQPRKDVASTYTMRDLAKDVMAALTTARAAYKDANFTTPNYQVKAIIQEETSNMNGRSGNVHIERGKMISAARVNHDSGHELFHVFQNQYYNVYGMGYRHWFMESTPDYISAVIWNNFSALDEILATYFDESLNVNDDPHAYQNSHFIRWLVDHRNVNFKAMWDYVYVHSSVGDDGFASVQNYVANVSGKTFATVFEDWVNYAMFDAGNPMAAVGSTGFTIPNKQDPTKITDSKTISVPSFAAKVVNVGVTGVTGTQTRSVSISATGLGVGSIVEIWKLTSLDGSVANMNRAAASLKKVLVRDSDSATFDLASGEFLSSVAINTGTATNNITVTASSISDSAVVRCNGLDIVIGARNGLKLIDSATPTVADMTSTCDFTFESACTAGTKSNITATIDFSKGFVFELCANGSCNYQGPNNFVGMGWNGTAWETSGQYRCTGAGSYPTAPAQCLAPQTYTTQWDCKTSNYLVYAQREKEAWIRVLIKKPASVAGSSNAGRN